MEEYDQLLELVIKTKHAHHVKLDELEALPVNVRQFIQPIALGVPPTASAPFRRRRVNH